MGADTGILFSHKSLIGQGRDYVLQIEARDGAGTGPFSDKAVINVHVLNANEHKPQFLIPQEDNSVVEITEVSGNIICNLCSVWCES